MIDPIDNPYPHRYRYGRYRYEVNLNHHCIWAIYFFIVIIYPFASLTSTAAARSILIFTLSERPNQTELPLPGPPSSDLTSAAARLDSRAAHDCFEETQVPPASVPDPAQLMASLARSVGAPHGRINAAVGFGCAGFNSRLAALPFRGMPTPPAA